MRVQVGNTIKRPLFAIAITIASCWQADTATANQAWVLASGDTRGRAGSCITCGDAIPLGGLTRRATAVKQQRQASTTVLLVDAGDFLFGGRQVSDPSRAMAAAYASLQYDAINLAVADFRLGKEHTITLLQEAGLPAVSANLLDEDTGRLLLPPYLIKDLHGRRIGVIGVAEPPRSRAILGHLRQQLEGAEVRDPREALAEHLPELQRRTEAIILLYAGSSETLAAIVEHFDENIDAIAASGISRDQWPDDAPGPPVMVPIVNGRGLARAILPADAPVSLQEPLILGPRYENDREMEQLLARHQPAAEEAPQAIPPISRLESRPLYILPEQPETGRFQPLQARFGNRGARVAVSTAGIFERFGEIEPVSPARRLLVVRTAWENIIPLTVLEQQALATEYRIPNLGDHLYLVVDGTTLVRLRADADQLPGHLPTRPLRLEHLGSRQDGYLVFDLPGEDFNSLELRFYDFAHGHSSLVLAGTPTKEPPPPAIPARVNEIVEVVVHDVSTHHTLGERRAPAGMTFVTIDLRARSMFTFEADATAFDPHAEPGERIDIGTVADWLEAHKYAHLVVDNEYAYIPEAALTTLPPDPRFLPDLMTGGRMVFLVPEQFESLVLRADFPNARMPDGKVMRPSPLHFTLRGEPGEPPAREPLWRVEDDTIEVKLTAQSVADSFAGVAAGEGEVFLVVDTTVRAFGDKPDFFQTREQLRYVDGRGRQHPPHPATFKGIHRPVENVWVPNGEQRSFQLAYLIDRAETRPRLAYRGFTMAEIVELARVDEEIQVAAVPATEEDLAGVPQEPDEDVAGMEKKPELDELIEVDVAVVDEPDEVEPAREGMIGFADTWTLPEAKIEEWMRQRNRAGVNLALAAYGGLVSTENRERDIPQVNDGRIGNYRNMTAGIYHVDLAGTKPAPVNQIAVVFYVWPANMKLIFEAADGEGGYTLIGSLQDEEIREIHLRVFEFEPIVTDEIRMTIDTTDGRRMRLTWLYEVMVFEGPLADKSESVLSSGGPIISRHEHGGSIFHTSDVNVNVAGLLTSPEEGTDYYKSWTHNDGPWSNPLKMAFQANRVALIDAIELRPSSNDARKPFLPKRIRLYASADQPFEGYTEIGEFEVTTDGEPWRLEFDQPIRARFLRFKFLSREIPDRRYGLVILGELAVYEGAEPGYVSVLIRGDGPVWRHREQLALDELMGEEAANVRSFTDDFLADKIAGFEMGEWVGSTISRPEQTHRFRVNLEYDSAAEIPELHLRMAPFIRGKVRILDAQGNEVAAPSPDRQSGTAIQFPLALDPGEYIVEVSSAPIYLFLGFDTSGSMTVALPITRDNLPDLTDNLPEGVYVALGTSLSIHGTSHGSFTLYSDYTNDPEALRHAITEHKIEFSASRLVPMFDPTGRSGSDWYNFLKDMLEWADENKPPEAIGALVLVGDGVGRGDYVAMWERLRKTNHRLYTVGWGNQTYRLDHMDSNTGWSAARGLFNAAWYRDGRYFEPQAEHEVLETYQEILRDIQTPAEYALRVETRKRQTGRLTTLAPPPREARPILFVLDASGSMMIELEGRTRLAVAQEVIERVVNALPDNAPVGLRVYGHRYRALGAEREQAAVDSELLMPIGPLDRAAFIRTVRGVNARGATPLAHTVEQIPRDLRGVNDPLVVVLTDGVESFRRDPVLKSRQLREARSDLEYVVIGFMIDRMVDRENLRGMAEAGQGTYYNAMDSASLVHSLEQALDPTIEYQIFDWQGREVASGTFGDSHELVEGEYQLRATLYEGRSTLPLAIRAGRTVQVAETDLPETDAATPSAVDETETEEAPAPSPAPPRFCTGCGQRLGEGARFCTGCGAPVR